MNDALRASVDVFQQTFLVTDTDRRVAESNLSYLRNGLQLDAGLRAIREQTAVGTDRNANEMTLGASQTLAGGRLKLNSTAEVQLDGREQNTDYPNRVLIGGEYSLSEAVSVITEQEMTFGLLRNTQDTRIGLKTQPWNNASAIAAVTRSQGEKNGERTFATTGLLQTLQLNEFWRLDVGVDRVQTLNTSPGARDPAVLSFDPLVPPASGSVDDDFTAAYVGAGYHQADWDATSRIEYHNGTQADKFNVLAGMSRQLADGKVVSGSFALRNEQQSDGAELNSGDLRFGAAWRPTDSPWAFLNRLDFVYEDRRAPVFDSRTRKLVENMNANYAPTRRWQLALQFGLKYARFKNLWASIGYNVQGFEDGDFTGADYRAQGPYLKLRFKVDQQSLKEFLGYASFDR